MLDIEVKIHRLEEAVKEAAKYSSRSMVEIANSTCLFIAKDALAFTYAPDKDKIKDAYMQPSRIAGNVPKMSILVNYWRGQNGKPGLNGQKMAIATDKAIRVVQTHGNFARSGWIGARNALAPYVKSKSGGAKAPAGVRQKISHSGGAIPAREGTGIAVCKIFNAIQGKDNHSTVERYQMEGLAKAIENQTNDKMEHIAAKKLEEGFISIFR